MGRDVRYASLRVRTECPLCGMPLPLAALALKTRCDHCKREVELPVDFWQATVDDMSEGAALLSEGREVHRSGTRAGWDINYSYAAEQPKCDACEEEFSLYALPVGQSQAFACQRCGASARSEPAPEWLKARVDTARQVFSAAASEDEGPAIVKPLYFRLDGPTRRQREEERKAEAAEAEHKARLVDDQHAVVEIEKLRRRAMRNVGLLWASVIGLIAFGFLVALPRGEVSLAFFGLVALTGLLLLTTIFRGTQLIGKVTNQPGEYLLFLTWFWVPFSCGFPGLGGIFALVRFLILMRGKFGAATISNGHGSNRRHYDAISIGTAGRPAAYAFLAIFALQLAFVIAMVMTEGL